MAKKRKKTKSKDIPLIVFVPEGVAEEQNTKRSLSQSRTEAFIPAEPGWRAVFAPCVSCQTEASSMPVVFWAYLRWEDGVSDVLGLVHGLDGSFFYPQADHTFIGYVGPGQEPEELIARLFDTLEE